MSKSLFFTSALLFASFHGRSFGTMPASPMVFEFLGDVFTIDINGMTPMAVAPKDDFDFNISSMTDMNLGKPLPAVPVRKPLASKRAPLQDVTYRMHTNQLERRPSELSFPSMRTDSFSSRRTTPDSHHQHRYYDENRNYGPSTFTKLDSPPKYKGYIYRSDANLSSPNLSVPRKKRSQTLLAFPPPPPPPVPQPHVSWQGEPGKPMTRGGRARSNTTPTRPPSNLSTCTTLDSGSSSNASSPLYMKFPTTPPFAPNYSTPPTVDIENEISCFDFDDDEESPRAKLAKVFRRRAGSNAAGDSTPERDLKGSLTDRPKRKFRKRMSDANQSIKEVFGIKK